MRKKNKTDNGGMLLFNWLERPVSGWIDGNIMASFYFYYNLKIF